MTSSLSLFLNIFTERAEEELNALIPPDPDQRYRPVYRDDVRGPVYQLVEEGVINNLTQFDSREFIESLPNLIVTKAENLNEEDGSPLPFPNFRQLMIRAITSALESEEVNIAFDAAYSGTPESCQYIYPANKRPQRLAGTKCQKPSFGGRCRSHK